MGHESEYDDALVTLLELIWGEGFMAPGGEGNVVKMVAGLELTGRRVLDELEQARKIAAPFYQSRP